MGIAKIRRFTPPPDSPPNMAPAGWYLSGVIVAEDYRRRGIGRRLTQARLNWIAERDRAAYYFSNARNRASIDLHRAFGFVELTRDFTFPGASFEGGVGILFKAELAPHAGASSLRLTPPRRVPIRGQLLLRVTAQTISATPTTARIAP